MPVEKFLIQLVPGDANFTRIQHDDVVTGVDMRRERGLVFAAKDVSDTGSETPQIHIRRIDHIPLSVNRINCGCVGLVSHLDLFDFLQRAPPRLVHFVDPFDHIARRPGSDRVAGPTGQSVRDSLPGKRR